MMSAVYLITRKNLLASVLEKSLREHFSIQVLSPKSVARNPEQLSNHIVLLDIGALPGQEFYHAMELISEQAPDATVAIINVDRGHNQQLIYRYVNIKGIFFTDDTLETLVKGIRELKGGVYWLSRKQMSNLLESLRVKELKQKKERSESEAIIEELTPRELEILKLVSTGATNIMIADQICLSENTVKTHLSNLYRKLDINNRTQATVWVKNNISLLSREGLSP